MPGRKASPSRRQRKHPRIQDVIFANYCSANDQTLPRRKVRNHVDVFPISTKLEVDPSQRGSLIRANLIKYWKVEGTRL